MVSIMERIKNQQTCACYLPIYYGSVYTKSDGWNNPIEFEEGYWFYDDAVADGAGCFGPYLTLDDVCKAQAAYYNSIMSL